MNTMLLPGRLEAWASQPAEAAAGREGLWFPTMWELDRWFHWRTTGRVLEWGELDWIEHKVAYPSNRHDEWINRLRRLFDEQQWEHLVRDIWDEVPEVCTRSRPRYSRWRQPVERRVLVRAAITERRRIDSERAAAEQRAREELKADEMYDAMMQQRVAARMAEQEAAREERLYRRKCREVLRQIKRSLKGETR